MLSNVIKKKLSRFPPQVLINDDIIMVAVLTMFYNPSQMLVVDGSFIKSYILHMYSSFTWALPLVQFKSDISVTIYTKGHTTIFGTRSH